MLMSHPGLFGVIVCSSPVPFLLEDTFCGDKDQLLGALHG